jgi:hypothetical protein
MGSTTLVATALWFSGFESPYIAIEAIHRDPYLLLSVIATVKPAAFALRRFYIYQAITPTLNSGTPGTKCFRSNMNFGTLPGLAEALSVDL